MRIIFFFIPIAFFAASSGFSQTDSTEKKNLFILKTDVLIPGINLLMGNQVLDLSIEFGFHKRYSVQLTGINMNIRNGGIYNKAYSNYLIQDYKYFLKNEKTYSGFYTGAYCDQIFVHAIADTHPVYHIDYKTITIGGGPIIGYQTYFSKQKFSFDFIFGLGRSYVVKREFIRLEGTDDVLIPPSDFDLRLAVNFGYRF